MKYSYLSHSIASSLLLFAFLPASGQCHLETYAIPSIVCKNQQVDLYAVGVCDGVFLFESFDNPSQSPFWHTQNLPVMANPCPPLQWPASGNVCWFTVAGGAYRKTETVAFDLSNDSTVYIEWDMKYGDHQTAFPCEDPDLVDEGVHLQFSISGLSGPWIDINYWAPTYNITGPLYSWNHYSQMVPASALSGNTHFRWIQFFNSSYSWDHWGIDNPIIYSGDSATGATQFLWFLNGQLIDTGTNTSVSPDSTTQYHCKISKLYYHAYDSIEVMVYKQPPIYMGPDTVLYYGESLEIDVSDTGFVSYLWSTGHTGPLVVFDSSNLQAGQNTIWVNAIYGNNCIASDTMVINYHVFPSIIEIEKRMFRVFPNPTTDMIYIESESQNTMPLYIDVMNLIDSRIIIQINEAILHNNTIDMSGLAKGVYLLRIKTSVAEELYKIIKL